MVLAGSPLADISVDSLIEESLRTTPGLPVVVMGRTPSYSEAVRLVRVGAADYVPWDGDCPLPLEGLADRIRATWEHSCFVRAVEEHGKPLDALVGCSKALRQVKHLIGLIAPRQATVLITGRTGSGKELVARAIHASSPRAAKPFVAVNCGAIPENLMEAELFGHVKGAFTGAVGHRVGRFEQAHRGTIFFDEVSELPLEMQSKLLRVLQEREFERVGSSEPVKVDLRVLAAANVDLKKKVQNGEFREDLYYRLNVIPIQLPTLAERLEDIPALVDHLVRKICLRENLPVKSVGREALDRMMAYDWPGNIRQLENAVEKAVVLSGDRLNFFPSDFPVPAAPLLPATMPASQVRLPAEGMDLDSVVSQMARSLMEQALQRSGGNKKRAADLLRIKRTTFVAKWRTLQVGEQHG
jgi:DNA-binding NtrC family response regulator